MPEKEDPVTIGREIRSLLTGQMGEVSHEKMMQLLKRFLRCWKQPTAYYQMISKSIKNLEEHASTKEYTRAKLVSLCKHLLPPDAYVQCITMLNNPPYRMKEHAVADTRIKMHKALQADNRVKANNINYRNCGEIKPDQYLKYFNNAVISYPYNPSSGTKNQSGYTYPKNNNNQNIGSTGGNGNNNTNNKRRNPQSNGNGGNANNNSNPKKPRTDGRNNNNNANNSNGNKAGNRNQLNNLGKSELKSLIGQLKKEGLTFDKNE